MSARQPEAGAAGRNAPDAIIIGPMRTGTSWIHQYLAARSDVCLPKGVKETFYFDRHYGQGPAWYAEYFQHHRPASEPRLVEVAPSYWHSPAAPERIAQSLGRPRLVAIIRDPVERSISHYRHLRRRGAITGPILSAIQDFPEIIEASKYSAGLERWEAAFGAGAVRWLFQADLQASAAGFTACLCRALDLPYVAPPHSLLDRRVYSAGDPPHWRLARAGAHMAERLHARRWHWLLNLAKAAGLKRVFFGAEKPSAEPGISPAEREAVASLLAADWQQLLHRLEPSSGA